MMYFLNLFEDVLWDWIGVPLIVFLGLYFSFRSRFVQIRTFPKMLKAFVGYFSAHESEHSGVHPLKAFFASVGGCIGIANIVAVCSAVQIGGPGALFWIWVTATIGTILKYSEVYLGLKFRVSDGDGGYRGGPMFYLKKAFHGPLMPVLFSFLLCIYGVEFYQFSVVTQSVIHNFHFDKFLVIAGLLLLVLYAGSGGVRRVGAIASAIIPLFLTIYVIMGLWVIGNHITELPSVLYQVVVSAFTGHAAVGGFVGSTFMMAMSYGVRRGCYSGDIGVGYAAIIYGESMAKTPEKQASLVFFDIFLDTIVVCTLSILLILLTGVWDQPIDQSMMVQRALEQYFPYMNFFMPLFIFLLGYSTINAYFVVGERCAEWLSPNWGKPLFTIYAIIVLILFSFVNPTTAQSVMTIIGGLLLVINCWGIWRLRNEISFEYK